MTVVEMRKCLKTIGTETWNVEAPGDNPGIHVPATKGNVALWYNYNRDEHGHQDEYPESEHCGCDVSEGEKWAANLWLADIQPLEYIQTYIDRIHIARKV